MVTHKINFGNWMVDLVKGIAKLRVHPHSSMDDLKPWEAGLSQVLEAQGILDHVKIKGYASWGYQSVAWNDPYDTDSSSQAQKALALALLNLTIDNSIKNKLKNCLSDKQLEDPNIVYSTIHERYKAFIELEEQNAMERAAERAKVQYEIMAKRNAIDVKIKENKKELLELQSQLRSLENELEWTYSPDWTVPDNQWDTASNDPNTECGW